MAASLVHAAVFLGGNESEGVPGFSALQWIDYAEPAAGTNAVCVRVHGQGNLGAKSRAEAITDIFAAIKVRRA